MQDRLTRLRAKMEEQGLAGIYVSAPAEDTGKTLGANRRYLSGFSGSMGHLLITPGQAFIAVESHGLSYAAYQTLKQAVTDLPAEERPDLAATEGFIESLRAIKEPGEL